MAWYSSATMVGRFLAPSVGGLLIVGQDFRWGYIGCGVAGVLTLLLAIFLPLSARREPAAALTTAPRRDWQQLRAEVGYVLRHRGIFTASWVQAAQYFAFGFLEVYLPLQLADAGWKAWQIGPLFTLQVLATTLSKPAMGRLADRLGRPKMIAGGLIMGALALALIPYVSGYVLLAACSGLFGIGISAVTAATAALVADMAHDTSYGAAMGVLSSIMDVGQSAGPIVGGLLVGAFGYRTAFVAVAALLVTTVVLFPSGVRPRPS